MTIDWPAGAYGQPLPIETFVNRAAVFKDGGNVDNAKEFVRFLVGEGWLAHYLDFAGERMLPTMPKLLRGAVLAGPGRPASHALGHAAADPPACPRLVHRFRSAGRSWSDEEGVWPKAVHRVVTENISPEQAVDEAIARIKQILSE